MGWFSFLDARTLRKKITGMIATLPQLLSIVMALVITSAVLLTMGRNPLSIYSEMLKGAVGDPYAVSQTLTQAMPIVFTGLAFTVAFRAGLFNIGLEGQLYVGAFAAAYVGFSLQNVPALFHIALALVAGGLAGVVWAFLGIIPKIKTGAHEVISTLMLTYIAILLTSYLVNYPFKGVGWAPYSPIIANTAELPKISIGSQLSTGFFLSIFFVALVYILLSKTVLGYEIRVMASNPDAAKIRGIKINQNIVVVFLISGFLSGFGGAVEVLGVHRRFIDLFSPGYGWDGIAVALIGSLNAVGVLLAAVFLGALRAGGNQVQIAMGLPLDIITMIQGIIILLLAAPQAYTHLIKRFRRID